MTLIRYDTENINLKSTNRHRKINLKKTAGKIEKRTKWKTRNGNVIIIKNRGKIGPCTSNGMITERIIDFIAFDSVHSSRLHAFCLRNEY